MSTTECSTFSVLWLWLMSS